MSVPSARILNTRDGSPGAVSVKGDPPAVRRPIRRGVKRDLPPVRDLPEPAAIGADGEDRAAGVRVVEVAAKRDPPVLPAERRASARGPDHRTRRLTPQLRLVPARSVRPICAAARRSFSSHSAISRFVGEQRCFWTPTLAHAPRSALARSLQVARTARRCRLESAGCRLVCSKEVPCSSWCWARSRSRRRERRPARRHEATGHPRDAAAASKHGRLSRPPDRRVVGRLTAGHRRSHPGGLRLPSAQGLSACR